MPTGEPRARGCAATARSVARDPGARKLAQDKARAKFYAKNVETVKSCKLALAEDLAHLGGVKVLYPLSEETLLIVAGALDSAGYRSASSYLSELRLQHIELDFAISPALERTFKKVNDAVTRGMGPAKKAPEVKLSAIDHSAVTAVVGAADAYVIAVHWLLRSDEVVGMSLSEGVLTFHEDEADQGEVTLRLPTSKSDQQGAGVARRLACICDMGLADQIASPLSCPTCAVRRQRTRLEAKFEWQADQGGADLPMFPKNDGAPASKAQLVEAWGLLTLQSEKPTGHSPRRTGAKRYTRLGWSVWMVQFMGRWAASTVLEYIEEAMAEVTASWAKCTSGSAAGSSGDRLAGTSGGCPKLGDRLDRLEQVLNDTRDRLGHTDGQVATLVGQVTGQRLVWSTIEPRGVRQWCCTKSWKSRSPGPAPCGRPSVAGASVRAASASAAGPRAWCWPAGSATGVVGRANGTRAGGRWGVGGRSRERDCAPATWKKSEGGPPPGVGRVELVVEVKG